jgi:hypothetical protein
MTDMGDVNGDGFDDIADRTSEALPICKPRRVTCFCFSAAQRTREGTVVGRERRPARRVHGFVDAPVGRRQQDGYDDVLVGVYAWDGAQKLDCGQARLYLGGPKGPADTPAWTLEGAGSNSHFAPKWGVRVM